MGDNKLINHRRRPGRGLTFLQVIKTGFTRLSSTTGRSPDAADHPRSDEICKADLIKNGAKLFD
jgi:hypothetical protein